MSLPRLGCQTCKLRRVKCDGREPVCLRCAKSQRVCQGGARVQGLNIIHNENAYASGHRKRPRGPRPVTTTVVTKDQFFISPNLSINLETQALSSYYYSYLQYTHLTPDIVRVTLDGVLPLWTLSPGFELVRLSATVVALALFSQTRHHAQAAAEASRRYSHLLCAMRQSLALPDERNIDAYLVAVSLMSRYEDIVHCAHPFPQTRQFIETLQSSLHHDGAIELLKFWRACSLHDLTLSTDTAKLTRRGVIKTALMRNLALPTCILNGANFGERGIGLDYDRLCVRIALARNELKSICSSKLSRAREEYIATANLVAYEAQEINLALQNLQACYTRPTDVQAQANKYIQLPCDDELPSIDEDFSGAVFGNNILAMKMLAISTRIEALELSIAWPGSSTEDHLPIQKARSDISFAAQALIRGLHSSLRKGIVNLHAKTTDSELHMDENLSTFQLDRLVWPLTVGSGIKEIDCHQNRWFKAHLARIGGVIGVRVLQDAESEQWMWF